MMKNIKQQLILQRERKNNFLLASLLGGFFGAQFLHEKKFILFSLFNVLNIAAIGLLIYNLIIFLTELPNKKHISIEEITFSGSMPQVYTGLGLLSFLFLWWIFDTVITNNKYNKRIKTLSEKILN